MVSMSAPGAIAEDDLKEMIAAELGAVRDRSFGLTTDVLAEADLTGQVSPLMSPPRSSVPYPAGRRRLLKLRPPRLGAGCGWPLTSGRRLVMS